MVMCNMTMVAYLLPCRLAMLTRPIAMVTCPIAMATCFIDMVAWYWHGNISYYHVSMPNCHATCLIDVQHALSYCHVDLLFYHVDMPYCHLSISLDMFFLIYLLCLVSLQSKSLWWLETRALTIMLSFQLKVHVSFNLCQIMKFCVILLHDIRIGFRDCVMIIHHWLR